MKIFKNKERKQIFLSALLLVIIIVLYIELNVLISKINIQQIDITEDKAYSISDETREKISKIDKDVKIKVFGLEKYNDNLFINNIMHIIDEFDRASDKITVEIQEEENSDNPYIIFESGTLARKVWINELYQYKYNSFYENQEDLYMIEPMIANSVIGVINESTDKIYICLDKSVYAEKNYLSFVSIASALGVDTYGLNLANDMKIPDDCGCLVIVPLVNKNQDGTVEMTDFSEEEKNVIVDYINKGGNILFLQESKSLINKETPNLDYILGLYGISISDGLVCQEDSNIQNRISYIYPEIETNNNVVKALKKESKVCLFDPGAININNDESLNTKQQVILKANDKAFIRKDISNKKESRAEGDVDASGAILGVYAEKKVDDKVSKIIVYSNSVIATNTPISTMDTIKNKKLSVEAILFDDNAELIADSIRALSNNTEAIYSVKKSNNLVPSINILTDNITLKIIFIIPMIILFVGFIVWRHRKNKK